MSSTLLLSVAVVLFCGYVSDAHWNHVFHRNVFLKRECTQASNNVTTQTDNCVQCFNESRISEPAEKDEVGEEPVERWFRPRPEFGFNRFNFNSTKLSDCTKEYLGTNYEDCSAISSSQNSKIESLRIIECIEHRFSEIAAGQCNSEVQNDNLTEYFVCMRNVFFKV